VQPTTDPTPILQLTTAYWGSMTLFAANDLRVFTVLAEGPKSAGDLAAALEVPERPLRLLLQGAAGLGLLKVADGRFANTDLALKPGMFATARVVLPASARGMFVARSAVLTDATTNSSQVFMIVEGKVRVAVVQIGETEGDQIRILAGIPDDAVLANDHLQDLYDGQSVNVTEPRASASGQTVNAQEGGAPHA